MIFAQIYNGQIQNTIILNNISSVCLFQNDPITEIPYDFVIQIDGMYPRPGIGWQFDGISFSAPILIPDDSGDGS